MLKSLITYLNLKLDLLNYFDLTRCLVELKDNSEGTRQPVEYISNGNYDVIDWDEFNGVSYWRLRDEITSDRTEEKKYKAGARNNIETTIPLKLVFAVPRTKLTEDDAYSFDRIRQTMVKQFAIDDDVIKTTLQAESVRINVVSANSDAKEVWEEETESTGTFEPKYETVFGSIDVDVVIISKHSCLPTECDDVESDIIRAFDWCGNTAVTVGRLTEAQQTCISDFICSCADATVQINGVEVATPASGGTVDIPVNLDGVPSGSWDGDSWEVTSNPCADATVQLNGVDMADIASGDTENILVLQSNDMTQVGSKQGTHWRIDDSAISINGSPVADVRAEDSLDIDVTQDGSPVGSWNGSAWIVPESGASLSISVSNTNPDFGDTVTITATPSGITPINYLYFAFRSSDDTFHFIAEQAGNSYDWETDILGEWSLHVIADNGNDFVSACEMIDVQNVYDADLTAYLEEVGITNDATVYNSTYGVTGADIWNNLNTFYLALKAEGGLYDAGRWMYMYMGGNANIAKINLFDPRDLDVAFRVTWNGGWLFNDEGRISNGSNTYGNTHFNASTELSNNSGAYFVYKRTQPTGTPNSAEWGTQGSTTDRTNLLFLKTTQDRSFYGIQKLKQVNGLSTTILDGFHCISRDNNASLQKWFGKDGAILDSDTNSTSANPNLDEYIGCRNTNGTPILFLENGATVAIEGRFDGLSDSQVEALRVAVINLMTSFGWNV